MFKVLADHIVQPLLKRYLKKKRTTRYKGLKLVVWPGVFHPGFFFSSRFLSDFVSTLPLKDKTLCEPGAGSGLISLTAYKKGALVTAYDINPVAVNNIMENFHLNFTDVTKPFFKTYRSDLFDSIPQETFDYIVINPPYFFEEANDNASKAWYCGKNGEYFEKLFMQLLLYSGESSEIYMVLADNCDLDRIERIAKKNGFDMLQIEQKKIWWELNYIFKITQHNLL